jgi:hypothetical protein
MGLQAYDGTQWVGVGGGGDKWELISSITTPSTSTITFSSIPTGYKKLRIFTSFITTSANTIIGLRFNSDSGNNYDWAVKSDKSSFGTVAAWDLNSSYVRMHGESNQQFSFDYTIIDNNLAVHKSLEGSSIAIGGNSQQEVNYGFGKWRNTNEISSISLVIVGSGNFNNTRPIYLVGTK